MFDQDLNCPKLTGAGSSMKRRRPPAPDGQAGSDQLDEQLPAPIAGGGIHQLGPIIDRIEFVDHRAITTHDPLQCRVGAQLMPPALDAMVVTNLDCLPVAELLDRACRLQRLTARIDAVRATVLAAADTASEAPGVLRELGFRNASQVVAATTGAPAREIHATARTGRWLDDFPVFAQAAAGGVLTLRHLRELKALDTPDRRDALVASQHELELVAAARGHDFVEFTNRLTVWLINHTDTDEVTEQVKKTSCTWNTNTDGSIDGRFHLDPLSAAAVGTALGDEMQRLFRQQSEGPGNADTPNRRRGQALVGLIVGGAEAPGSATTTPLVNLVIGQKILENFLERFVDPDTVWPCFARPTRVCHPANSLTRRWIGRCLPQANSGLPGNARQTVTPTTSGSAISYRPWPEPAGSRRSTPEP